MNGYCDVYKWTILKRTSSEVKCLHPTSSRREMCTLSVSNVIYHKFSHGAAFYTLYGKNVNVMLELIIIHYGQQTALVLLRQLHNVCLYEDPSHKVLNIYLCSKSLISRSRSSNKLALHRQCYDTSLCEVTFLFHKSTFSL